MGTSPHADGVERRPQRYISRLPCMRTYLYQRALQTVTGAPRARSVSEHVRSARIASEASLDLYYGHLTDNTAEMLI